MDSVVGRRKMTCVALQGRASDARVSDRNRIQSCSVLPIRDEMLHTNLGHLWAPILLRVYHDSRTVAEVVEHCRAMIAQVITEYPTNAVNMIKK
jgi:hypothetical protein